MDLMTMSSRIFLLIFAATATIASAQQAPGVQALPPSPISQADLSRRLSSAIDSLTAAGQFSGVVVLAKDAVPVYEVARGFADREHREMNNLETAFNIGSINKVFTQIALMQLVAAGKLNLDST